MRRRTAVRSRDRPSARRGAHAAGFPRYASITRGSRRTSSGCPRRSCARIENGHPVADTHDHLHVVLDEEDGQAELGAETRDELHQVLRLLGVHARRGLVEEQQLRAGGKRARDLEAPLVAVGEVLGELVADPVQPDVRQELLGPTIADILLPARPGRAQEAVHEVRMHLGVHPDEHILHGRHVLEEADVLEGAGDAGLDHVVGPGAAEDAQAGQEHLVPERAHDREQERRDQEADRDDAGEGDPAAGQDPRHPERETHQDDEDRRGDPDERLEADPPRAGDHRPPVELDPARGRVDDPEQDVEERRLARTVGADEADDRPLGDREVHLVHRDEAAEAARDLSATRMSRVSLIARPPRSLREGSSRPRRAR